MARVLPAAVAGVALLGAGLAQSPATHAMGWCFDDPVISINGQQFHILNGVQDSSSSVSKDVQGASVTVYVPRGVSARIVNPTGQLFIETVVIKTTASTWTAGQPVPVQVNTSFVTRLTLPGAQQVTTATGTLVSNVTGMTGQTITGSFSLP
jgi:hypothetical protein